MGTPGFYLQVIGGETIPLDRYLRGEAGVQALEGLSGFGLPPVQAQWFDGAGDGAVFNGRRTLPRTIDMPLLITGRNRQELVKEARIFSRVLQKELYLMWDDPDEGVWWLRVVHVGGGDYVYGEDTIGNEELRLTLTFRAGDPYWTRLEPDVKILTRRDTTGSFLENLGQLIVSNSSTMVDTFDIMNDGDVPAYPIIRFIGPGENIEISNGRGRSLRWSSTIKAGGSITFDMRKGTVTDGAGKNVYYNLDPAPDFFPLQPGLNRITAKMSNTSSGSAVSQGVVRRNLVRNPQAVPNGGPIYYSGVTERVDLYTPANGRPVSHPLAMENGSDNAAHYEYVANGGLATIHQVVNLQGDDNMLSHSVYVWHSHPQSVSMRLDSELTSPRTFGGNFSTVTEWKAGDNVTVPPGVWTRLTKVAKVSSQHTTVRSKVVVPDAPAGMRIKALCWLSEEAPSVRSYFDGGMEDTSTRDYRWSGGWNSSMSELHAIEWTGISSIRVSVNPRKWLIV